MKKRKIFLTSIIFILSLIYFNNTISTNKPSNTKGYSLTTSINGNTNDSFSHKLEGVSAIGYDKKININL